MNRGGSWNNEPRNVRSANRNRNTTDNRNNNLGFRLASTPTGRDRALQGGRGRASGRPGPPRAFVTVPGQGICYARNPWHGVLTPYGQPQDFVVVDRGGPGANLEEHTFAEPWTVHLPGQD